MLDFGQQFVFREPFRQGIGQEAFGQCPEFFFRPEGEAAVSASGRASTKVPRRAAC